MGSLSQKGKPGVAIGSSPEDLLATLPTVINNMLAGRLNITGQVTLRANATSTTVSDMRCSYGSIVLLMATSSTGAVALDQWSVQTITDGSFTITHISTSTANCTATYALVG